MAEAQLVTHALETPEPIAIVGMACRFPGAASLTAFWQLLREGRSAIVEIPRDRFDLDALYAAEPATPGRIMTRWGGFLEHLDRFDAAYFGISPREAERLDPQQRLLLELAREALDDAGQRTVPGSGSHTGVFVGMWLNEYESRLFRDPSAIDFYMTTGTGRYTASGRLSHVFDFNGPSFTVDTACSSSLVAVHLACQSLRSGECNTALVGAANVILEPFITIAYSQSRMMAPDGRCKFGDAAADGYVRSDGAAALLLKPLSRALADGDRVYATILGSSVTNDGSGSGSLGTPGAHGQREMLSRAYAAAGVSPASVDYIEAHGTGTRAGDPVEIGAIGAIVGEGRARERPCRVGSVKTNIGHTEGAAGLAGLIKVVLSLQHELVPQSLHYSEPAPSIPWETLPVVVNSALSPWPRREQPRIGGVSSFGIAGTNAHVVLSDAPPPAPRAPVLGKQLVLVSGHTAEARSAAIRALARWLPTQPEIALADLAYTSSVRRQSAEYRVALLADSVAEVQAGLESYLAGEVSARVVTGQAELGRARKVAFVFPGQGAQWLGMGRELYRHNLTFAQELRRCDAAVRELTGWSVIEELQRAEGQVRFEQIDAIQPLLFSLALSYAAAFRALGVQPSAVIGHSMGEVAAACVAGALSLEDAARIVCRRSALLRRVSGKGAMAVVELPLTEAEAALAGYEDRVSVAVSNSRRSTVLSGDPGALDQILSALEAREVFCRRIRVDVASHSPQMDPLAADLRDALQGLTPKRADLAIYSTVTCAIESGEALTAAYWVKNLREPVRFSTMALRLLEDGYDAFLEMSPHPLLGGALSELAEERGAAALTLCAGRRDEDDLGSFLTATAAAHCAGLPVDFEPLFPERGRLLSLPAVPWQREHFWYEPVAPPALRAGTKGLLGDAFNPAAQPGTSYFQLELDVEQLPFLADHRVNGAVVVPAALFIELGLEAAEACGLSLATCHSVQIGAALVLAEDRTRRVQIVLTRQGAAACQLKILGCESSDAADPLDWTEHASLQVQLGAPAVLNAAPAMAGGVAFDAASHYQAMERRGLEYGAAFRLVLGGHRSQAALSVEIAPPVTRGGRTARLERSTRLLDACLQAAVAALPDAKTMAAGDTYVPVSFESVFLSSTIIEGNLSCEVAPRAGDPSSDTWAADVTARDAAGREVVRVSKLQLRRIASERARLAREALYSLSWLSTAAPRATSTVGRWLVLGEPELAGALSRAGATASAREPGELSAMDDERWDRVVLVAPQAKSTDLRGETARAFARALAVCQWLAARDQETRVWMVTCQALSVVPGDAVRGLLGAPWWGLRSVFAAEYPRLRVSCIDLESGEPPALETLAQELLAPSADDEIALRGAARFVRRLTPGLSSPALAVARPAAHRPYRLVSRERGILDSLGLEAISRPRPAAFEIEIEIEASGLNFMNVLGALGACPGFPNGAGPLGIECAGRVLRVGTAVSRFVVGERVMAFAHDSMATHALAHERLALRVPDALDFESAATLPIAYLTAHYALVTLARVREGEHVLIHSAAGGVGLAALAVARRVGARVIATAGSAAKREFLHTQGVAEVGDSRSLSFVEFTRRVTDGQGVDVVLNSLSGEAATAGLSLLRAGGRFVELGKRDIYDNRSLGLLPFQRNLAYFAVDLERVAREEPARLGSVFDELSSAIECGAYPALPRTVYASDRAKLAFVAMSAGQHIGKLVVRMDREQPLLREPSTVAPAWSRGVALITGGTGGLGLAVARWMVEQGARHLVLTGRRPEQAALSAELAPLRARARVDVIPADVSSEAEVHRLFEYIDALGGPLLGVVHAAGVLHDATLLELKDPAVRDVFAPKVDGAFNLHAAVAGRSLDFFVLFSSVASFLGLAGQANYAAANAALDALAAQRRAAGLAGISIAWGPWAEVGLAAARTDRGARLAERGLGSLSPEVALSAFAEVLHSNPVQAVVMTFDPARFRAASASAQAATLFANLDLEGGPATAGGSVSESAREQLLAVPIGPARRAWLEARLQQFVAAVLRLPAARIDVKKPLRTLGLDSLMGLELRNRLEQAFQIKLPATLIWNYPTLSALAGQLALRLNIPLDAAPVPPAPAPSAPPSARDAELDPLLAELEALSDEEAQRLLAGES